MSLSTSSPQAQPENASTVLEIIHQTVRYLQLQTDVAPDATAVVEALRQLEKQQKRAKPAYGYSQLLGTWRLGFVSGTRSDRPRPGATPVKKLGKGRFLPRLVTIKITYSQVNEQPDSDKAPNEAPVGQVQNSVTLGPLQLTLTGPTRFWPKTDSLGFDFTRLQAQLGPLTLYKGTVRGGEASAQAFVETSLKDQAFFTFFWIEEDCIAARGKGGGLALWTRN